MKASMLQSSRNSQFQALDTKQICILVITLDFCLERLHCKQKKVEQRVVRKAYQRSLKCHPLFNLFTYFLNILLSAKDVLFQLEYSILLALQNIQDSESCVILIQHT